MPLFTQQSAYAHAPAYPRHVVTAILVAHDGARWLPGTLTGLLGQERPVQRVVAVDTGSTDATPRLLEDALGPTSVIRTDRTATFGAAVADAVRTVPVADAASLPYAVDGYVAATDPYGPDSFGRPDESYPGGRSGELVEWLWLLHDDSEPAPDALHLLLRAADELPSAGVLGPKVRSWYDRRRLLEVGTTIARSGRRWTGLERREQDQGQHDAVRGVLAVGSAGLLVRRDVWEQLGGFDPRLPFGRDDTDFCWRTNAAGHRVVVVPEAVVLHAEAATRERRPIDCAADHPHRVDRAGAVYTLLANSPGKTLPLTWLRLFFGTIVRVLGYLVGKLPRMALDEFIGVYSVLLRPYRFISGRRARARTRVVDDADFRDLFPPRGASVRHAFDALVGSISRRVEPEGARARNSVLESGPTSEDTDDLEVENFARLRAVVQRPGVALAVLLLLVTLAAARDILTGGRLLGGALLPVPDTAGDLISRFTETWHGVGLGGDSAAPPYLAIVGALGVVLFGSAGTAVSVLLIGSVPLAGITAYLSARKLVASSLVRAWGAAVYALLPVATGAVAQGRIGTAVVLIVAPIVARGAVQVAGLGGLNASWRAAWGTGLALAVAVAFVPLSWVIAVVLAVAALPAAYFAGTLGKGLVARVLIMLAVPIALLVPWSLELLSGDRLLLEPGLAPEGLSERGAHPVGLMLLDPGGPGTITMFVGIGLLLAALAALLRDSRRRAVLTAWAVAAIGLVVAIVVSRIEVTAPADGSAVAAWPGVATIVVGLGYVAAAMVGAEDARARVTAISFGWRQPAAVVVAVIAAVTPLAAAGAWLWQGASGPLDRQGGPYLPAFIASDNTNSDRARTLVLRTDPAGAVTATLVRGSGIYLGDADVAPEPDDHKALDEYVAAFLSGTGSADAHGLAAFAIRYILVQPSSDPAVITRLDGTPGLLRKSAENGTTLWRVEGVTARVSITQPDGTSVPVASGPDDVATRIDPGPEGRILNLAERPDAGWRATLDGRPLKSAPAAARGDGTWGQAFQLPASGGRLAVTYEGGSRNVWLIAQGVLLLVVVVLALPARRRGTDDDLPETGTGRRAAGIPAQGGGEAGVSEVSATLPGGGRRARRVRAAAEAEGTGAPDPTPTGTDTGSLFVPASPGTATATEPEPAAAPDDDWDLARYARGFQPREGIPGDGGGGYPEDAVPQQGGYAGPGADHDTGSYGYEQPAYAPGYEQSGYPQQGYQDGGYDQSGYEQSGYGQGAYPQQAYDPSGAPQAYPDPGREPGGYGPDGYGAEGYGQAGYGPPYDPNTPPPYPASPPDQAPGDDDPWPPQQPPRPGGTR
ncbi:glycosyltransferase [Streptodolium elevatio]|uniref:Glycosyltransferase n=1 Tax=Streptodolium elevatio TaxID=3157996 RepID=A0ABV3DVK9_9ACTN